MIKMAQSLGKRGICQEAAFAQGHTVAGCKSQIARIQPPRKRQALLRNKLPQLLATGVALESPGEAANFLLLHDLHHHLREYLIQAAVSGSFAREPTEEVLQVWRQADVSLPFKFLAFAEALLRIQSSGGDTLLHCRRSALMSIAHCATFLANDVELY